MIRVVAKITLVGEIARKYREFLATELPDEAIAHEVEECIRSSYCELFDAKTPQVSDGLTIECTVEIDNNVYE